MKHNIFCFHIEPTRGCTRRCDFCGIQAIKEQVKEPTFMSVEMAEDIAMQIKQDFKERIRIDFSLHGEPLMNPDIIPIVAAFRKHLPKAQLAVISNGDMIAKRKVDVKKLFAVGLNFLMIDEYTRSEQEFDALYEELALAEVPIYDYFKDKVSIWHYNPVKMKGIVLVRDLKETSNVTRKVHTAGGNLAEGLYDRYKIDATKLPMLRQCSKPFTELSVNADGSVSICCEDWSRKGVIGNVKTSKLIDIWDSEAMEQVRYVLHKKRRDLIPLCSKCNEVSFRTGLYKPTQEFPDLIKNEE